MFINQILKNKLNYFKFISYFYKHTVFSSFTDIFFIFFYYSLGAVLLIISFYHISELFEYLILKNTDFLQIKLYKIQIAVEFIYYIFFLFFIVSASFLLFYKSNRRIIIFSGSVIKKLTKKYWQNQKHLNKYLSTQLKVGNELNLIGDLNIGMRLTRLALSNLFDFLIVILLTTAIFLINKNLFFILSILFIILLYIQILTSKNAFNYQQLFKKSVSTLRKNFKNIKLKNNIIDNYIEHFINRLLIVEKSRSYSNIFFIFVVISFAIYLYDVSFEEKQLTFYSIFILFGIRIYYISCKNIFSYFTSVNRFYLNMRKIIILISFINKDYEFLAHTYNSIKTFDIFNQDVGNDEI
jgi:hypothetical protein